jgi:16S rRNA (guanine527-N7)-methyltransferase
VAALEEGLRAGLAALSLELSDRQVDQLMAYAALLQKWTRVYNLTSLRDPADIVSHHLLDCAAVIRPLEAATGRKPRRLLDVGAGGGLPGVVIAVACPEVCVDCVDTVAKKAAFVQQVAAEVKLPNLLGVHGRVEQVTERYDVITSRAFSSLPDFVSLSSAALGKDGIWMAMKGKYPAEEVAGLPADVELFHVERLQVPGLVAERCLMWLRRRRG